VFEVILFNPFQIILFQCITDNTPPSLHRGLHFQNKLSVLYNRSAAMQIFEQCNLKGGTGIQASDVLCSNAPFLVHDANVFMIFLAKNSMQRTLRACHPHFATKKNKISAEL